MKRKKKCFGNHGLHGPEKEECFSEDAMYMKRSPRVTDNLKVTDMLKDR